MLRCHALDPKPDIGRPSLAGSACHFLIIIVIRHETTAAARWALLPIVRTLFDDAITVAVRTGFSFHVCLSVEVSIEWSADRSHGGLLHPHDAQSGIKVYMDV